MLSQHFCFSHSPKSYLYPSNYCTLSKSITIMVLYIPSKCVMYYDPTVECNALDYFIFAAMAVCMLVIFIIFITILLILYPTKVCLMHFAGGMLCTCLWNHFRDSTRMVPMVLVTSEWFLHHSSSSGYWYWLHSKIATCLEIILLFKLEVIKSMCTIGKCFFFLCYCQAIQIKLYEQCQHFDPIIASSAITCNKQFYTNKLDSLHSVVRHSTHGTDILYLLCAGKEDRHYSMSKMQI